jgi:hypothetical protein
MTVTVDIKNTTVLNLLRDLESLNFIELLSPVSDAKTAGIDCPLCAQYHEPNAETIAALDEADAIERGEISARDFDTAEAFLADLKG